MTCGYELVASGAPYARLIYRCVCVRIVCIVHVWCVYSVVYHCVIGACREACRGNGEKKGREGIVSVYMDGGCSIV